MPYRLLRRSLAVLFLAASLTSISPNAGAQQPVDAPSANAAMTLDFPGGTAAEYIASLRRANPNANIVVLGELARVRMAPVQLKNVDVLSALSVLDQIPQSQGSFEAKIEVHNVASSQDVPDVYTVTAHIHERGPSPGQMQTSVISMADVLGESLKAADALTAIQTALELIGAESEPAQIKFHEETGLLIARGTPEQIETIRQVNSQLRERAGTLEMRAQNAQAAQQQSQYSALSAAARRDAEAAQNETVQWRTKYDVLQQAMAQLQKQNADLEMELRTIRAEAEANRRALADLQSKVKDGKP